MSRTGTRCFQMNEPKDVLFLPSGCLLRRKINKKVELGAGMTTSNICSPPKVQVREEISKQNVSVRNENV